MEKTQQIFDCIDGDTIILHDKLREGSKILKKVRIITPTGEERRYKIKRTSNGKYLFN
jgi:hypothetical protein